MSDQWSADPGAYPPAPSAVPTGWQHPARASSRPTGPPPFGSGPALPPLPPRRRAEAAHDHPQPAHRRRACSRSCCSSSPPSLVVVVRTDDDEVAAGSPRPPTHQHHPRRRRRPRPAPAPSSSTPPTTVDPTPTGPPPTPEELDAEIAELSEFVERERGLRFIEPVTVTMADEADVRRAAVRRLRRGAPRPARSRAASSRRSAWSTPTSTSTRPSASCSAAGVLGFYDPETAELVIRGQAITPYTRQTIVHELTHALDDQHFELDRPEYDDLDDETGFGLQRRGRGQRPPGRERLRRRRCRRPTRPARRRGGAVRRRHRAARRRRSPRSCCKILAGARTSTARPSSTSLLDVGGQPLARRAPSSSRPPPRPRCCTPTSSSRGIGALDGRPARRRRRGRRRGHVRRAHDPVHARGQRGPVGRGQRRRRGGPATGTSPGRTATDSAASASPTRWTPTADLDELEDAYTSWAEPRGATVERIGDRLEVTSCSARGRRLQPALTVGSRPSASRRGQLPEDACAGRSSSRVAGGGALGHLVEPLPGPARSPWRRPSAWGWPS